MPETYTPEELAAETAKIQAYYPSLPRETCERHAKVALDNKAKSKKDD